MLIASIRHIIRFDLLVLVLPVVMFWCLLTAPMHGTAATLNPAPQAHPAASSTQTRAFINAARTYVNTHPIYRSAYHKGGYPPSTEGVCTDVIWAALQGVGYDLKNAMDGDIRTHRTAYPRVSKPDPNIDFRRVPNQIVFFKRFAQSLPRHYDEACFAPDHTPHQTSCGHALWQPGDVVSFQGPDHIAIISDRRNRQGIPYLIHNQGPWATEGDNFSTWQRGGITGHFRLFPALTDHSVSQP